MERQYTIAGPWTVATTLRGADKLIDDTVDDPQFCSPSIALCTTTSNQALVYLYNPGDDSIRCIVFHECPIPTFPHS